MITYHKYLNKEVLFYVWKVTNTQLLKPERPWLWCATRQVDKLNNENFFLPRYSLCTGLFMQRFLVFVHGIPVV